MKQSAEIIPATLEAFKREIKHLKGAQATDKNKAAGLEIINHYTGKIQLMDLNLSQQSASDLLAAAYRTL